jgi:phosphate-selective porin OprO/OprP
MLSISLITLVLLGPPEPSPASEPLQPIPAAEPAPDEVPDLRHWRAWPVWPTLLAEIDGKLHADRAEGNDGFAVGRFRLGLRGQPLPWLGFAGTVEAANAQPGLLDAFVVLTPVEGVRFDVGYAKAPLLSSFITEPVHSMPFPDRAPVVNSFRTRRDLGIGLTVARREVPLELRMRVGNGGGGILGNDDHHLASYAGLDLVLGRARVGGRGKFLGLRVGAVGAYEKVAARTSVRAAHPLGYVYAPGVPIAGPRAVGTGHVIGYIGPARLTFEAAIAREARIGDLDGDPLTPDEAKTAVWSGGLTAELAVVVLGEPREVGLPPGATRGAWRGGVVEIAGRFDGMAVNRHAEDIAPGGSLGGAMALRWWPVDLASLTLAGYGLRYDHAPVDQPDRQWSWGLLLRLGVYWGLPVGSDARR